MAKLDMRKALAGAVAPLDVNRPTGESSPGAQLVDDGLSAAASADVVDQTILNTDVVQPVGPSNQDLPDDTDEVEESTSPVSPTHMLPQAKPASRQETATASLATAMGVDVEEELDARLVAYRTATRLSFHQIILDAVEHSYPALADLVDKALGRQKTPAPQVRLFERTFVPGPVTLEGKKERMTHTIRITATNRSMLDDITAEVKAPSRNFMICVALDHYLPA